MVRLMCMTRSWRTPIGLLFLASGVSAQDTAATGSCPPGAHCSGTSPSHLHDRFQISLSATGVMLNSSIRVDGEAGFGTNIDAEDDLGLARFKLQPRMSLRWHPGRRHELEVGYQVARRTGQKVLSGDIVFGDTTFTLGLTIRPTLRTDQGFLNYRFAFAAKERMQIGFGVGLGAIFFNTSIDALAVVASGGDTLSKPFTVSKSLVGPTAAVGLFGRFRSGDRWYFETDVRAIKMAIGRFDAAVFEGDGAVRYFLSRAVGLEAGYGITALDVDVAPKATGVTAGLSGKVKYSLQNFRVGLVVAL
jgi:hypothetical protein